MRVFGYFTEPCLADPEIHRIVGEPARVAGAPDTHHRLKVVSWNIERGVRFDAIADVLRSFDADILVLQEVDRFCRRSGNRGVARDLAAELGMNWVAAGEFQEIGEGQRDIAATTDQAVLSRYPISDPAVIVFDAQVLFRWRFNPAQPRRGGRIVLKARVDALTVFNLHLESGGSDALRLRQLDQVLADAAFAHGGPIVMAGDFNNSADAQPVIIERLSRQQLKSALPERQAVQTHNRHTHPIDWIFVSGAAPVAGGVEQAEGVSDHSPVAAELRLQ
jgi:endonuclease/exonuclease/phosphatase family metal-dependent hydrolase